MSADTFKATGAPALDVMARIRTDLNFFRKPTSMSVEEYSEHMVYSAMHEWIKTICYDTDPLYGNNKVGVSRQYLEDRAAETLADLSAVMLGIKIPTITARKSVSWMIDAMLEVGEIWSPDTTSIICMPNSIVDYYSTFVRVTGVRQRGDRRMPLGLATYMPITEAHDIASLKRCRALAEGLSMENADRENFLSMNACREEFETSYPAIETAKGYAKCIVNIRTSPSHHRRFLLATAWPVCHSPLDWPSADMWFVPNPSEPI